MSTSFLFVSSAYFLFGDVDRHDRRHHGHHDRKTRARGLKGLRALPLELHKGRGLAAQLSWVAIALLDANCHAVRVGSMYFLLFHVFTVAAYRVSVVFRLNVFLPNCYVEVRR